MTQLAGISAQNGRLQNFLAWGARAEDADSVARRLLACLRAIESIDGTSIDSWFDSKTQLPLDLATLTDHISDEVVRDEKGGAVPLLGFSLRVIRFETDTLPALEFDISAGSGHAIMVGKRANSVFVNYRGDREVAREYFAGHADAVLKALVEAWQPDLAYAGVVPQMLATGPAGGAGLPGISAISWFSRQFAIPATVPNAEVEPYAGGHVIYLGSALEVDTSVESASAVHEFLVANGLTPAAASQP